MPDRNAFLEAIAADPAGDLPRLAYADWLDDRGEADLAEFIRVQCALEPVRDRHELDGVADLHRRENELSPVGYRLREPAVRSFVDTQWDVHVEVRRGFPHSLAATATDFAAAGAKARKACPTLRLLRLFVVNGRADRLAGCRHLAGWPELELACWFTPAEAAKLAANRHLRRLERLTVWLDGRDFVGAIPSEPLVRLVAGSTAWPHLHELALFDPDGDQDAERLARLADEVAGRPLARVVPRPDGRLPFAPGFDYFCPGVLPDGRRVVAKPTGPAGHGWPPPPHDRLHVIVFGDDHRPADGYDLPLPDDLRAAAAGYDGYVPLDGGPPEVAAAVHRAVGSTPAFIRVLPFRWPDDQDCPSPGPEHHHGRWHDLGFPDSPGDDEMPEFFGAGGSVDWVVRTGQFGCGNGWCDNTGTVHST